MFGRWDNRAWHTDRAFRQYRNLHDIEPKGLDVLAGRNLNGDQRRDLLSRLQRPDYPGLVGLVIADLKYKHSGGFGSHTIHGRLLLSQLDELVGKVPKLRNQNQFVSFYIAKLRPLLRPLDGRGYGFILRYDA